MSTDFLPEEGVIKNMIEKLKNPNLDLSLKNSIFDDVDGVRKEYHRPPESNYEIHDFTGRREIRPQHGRDGFIDYGQKRLEDEEGRFDARKLTYHHVSVNVSKDFTGFGGFLVQTTVNSVVRYTTKNVPLERIKEAKRLHEDLLDYSKTFAETERTQFEGQGAIIDLPELPVEQDEKSKPMNCQLIALLGLPPTR